MSKILSKVKLSDVCDSSIGFVGTVTDQYQDDGVPFFRTLNIKPYELDVADLKRITPEFHSSQAKSQLFTDDIIMVHTGVPGICCVIPEEYSNSNCIDAIVIKCNKEKVNPYYLEAYMNTVGVKHIAKQQVGCVQKHFNLRDAQDLTIFLPSIDEQKIIANLVQTINKKISINKRTCAELEVVMRDVYSYWFTQFNFPNESGKPYKLSGGKMIYDNLLKREIPVGWKVQNLLNNDICFDIKPGVEKFDDEKTYYATANVEDNEMKEGVKVDYDNRESRANMQPIENSIWFAKMKNSIKHITVLPTSNDLLVDSIFSTGFFGIKANEVTLPYIRSFIYSDYFEKAKDLNSHGATMEAINSNGIKNIKLLVPSIGVLRKYAELTSAFLTEIDILRQENLKLISLREWLLPMLMSKQVRIDN